MPNGSTGGPVRPVPDAHLRALCDPRPTADEFADALRRAFGCGECRRLGHICRPCRKRAYEARHGPVVRLRRWLGEGSEVHHQIYAAWRVYPLAMRHTAIVFTMVGAMLAGFVVLAAHVL
jgi:hypothetical protein